MIFCKDHRICSHPMRKAVAEISIQIALSPKSDGRRTMCGHLVLGVPWSSTTGIAPEGRGIPSYNPTASSLGLQIPSQKVALGVFWEVKHLLRRYLEPYIGLFRWYFLRYWILCMWPLEGAPAGARGRVAFVRLCRGRVGQLLRWRKIKQRVKADQRGLKTGN